MKKTCVTLFAPILLITCSSWGFYAHRKINYMAVFTLPSELSYFYKQHIQYLSEQAVTADKRVYVDTAESPRHYIDLDRFADHPIDSLTVHWSIVSEKFTRQQLLSTGIIPWHIERTYRNLVHAFIRKDLKQILRYSADIGHYIGDAHVPLHTTSNYNGQFTNQIGIHAFWESRLPELFADRYNFIVGRARYISQPLQLAWDIIKHSHSLVDSVLQTERLLNNTFATERKYAFYERNSILVRGYSDEYAAAYHEALHGMVEQQMRASVIITASYWYSAWADAGQPDLKKLTRLYNKHLPDDPRLPHIDSLPAVNKRY